MESSAGLSDCLSALLADPSADAGTTRKVLASDELEDAAWHCPAAEVVGDDALAQAIRSRKGEIEVLATPHVGPTLLRALREFPPRILVVTGDLTPSQRADLETLGGDSPTRLLGPRASLRVGTGEVLACATSRDELGALTVALDGAALELCPTPSWLPELLVRSEAPDAVGYVDWECLDLDWIEWARGSRARNVIVPVGVSGVATDRPRHPELSRAAATHALEAWTGPVYPAPRVIAAVHRGAASSGENSDQEAGAHPLWSQARRALPGIGGMLGMETPLTGLDMTVPTAAFLAQRALLHMHNASRCLDDPLSAVEAPGEAMMTRARDVLAGSGEVLSEHESKVVLRGFGIEITRQAVANSASGAATFADRIGYPVVLKAVSPDLRRKAELGAVKLGLTNAAAVKRGYSSVVHAVEENAPTARVDGVAVAEMIEPGQEVHCGGVRMASGDVAFFGRPVGLAAPVEPCFALASADSKWALLFAHSILSRLPSPALRRASDPTVHTLASLFVRVHELFAATGDRLLLVDLSPIRLLASDRGYVTLDARIVQRAHIEGQ